MISFLLNDGRMNVDDGQGGQLLLDFLRRGQALCGTKEGCREGECGACVVLLGRLRDGRVSYEPVPSCVVPLGELSGTHVVTIEGLNRADGPTPVQAAIVAEGATQCGFCTPGIVVSLTHAVAEHGSRLTRDDVKTALSGHLCRCTGYLSLLRAGDRLRGLWPGPDHDLGRLVERRILPRYFLDVARRLAELGASLPEPESHLAHAAGDLRVAGGTDLLVERGATVSRARIRTLPRTRQLREIRRVDGALEIGALVTFEELRRSVELRAIVPDIERLMFPVASYQIRNRATLGGNVINASPIGDMTILFLALDAELHLTDHDRSRRVPLREFFRDYKQIDLGPSELLTHLVVSLPVLDTRVAFDKVAKRRCLDIASVNSAMCVGLRDGVVDHCRIAVGGVAPVPKLLRRAASALVGRRIDVASIREMLPLVQEEIDPIDDIRGSAGYKRLLAHRLVVGHFARLFPEAIAIEEWL